MTPERLQEIIARAKAEIAAKAAGKIQTPPTKLEIAPVPATVPSAAPVVPGWTWNAAQREAITSGVVGKSFVLIGAAGTGKTTTLRGLLQAKLEQGNFPMFKTPTGNFLSNTPGVALVSFTRRAVRNIARQMPAELKTHCMTIHRLLEYAPETYYEMNEQGVEVKKMRFAPQRHGGNPLPEELVTIVVDESSMVSVEQLDLIKEALPYPARVQFIFLGDLNQLPPVYGHPALGQQLLRLPIIELTEIYRQALESPIISLALAVKNNNFTQFNKDAVELWSGDRFKKPDGTFSRAGFDAKDLNSLISKTDKKAPATITLEKEGRGKITLQVWKNRTETEVGLAFMQGQLKAWIDSGVYDPEEDLVLCPWNKSFGSDELSRAIATKCGQLRNAEVHEIIAGFQKFYYAVGDKLLIDKNDAIVTSIEKNPKYYGKRPAQPSKKMDRWGNNADRSILASDMADVDIDALLEDIADVSDRTAQASHILRFRYVDSDGIGMIDKASQFNATAFAYAITVHKAQGSECRKVFVLSHYCHSAMLFRELVYTAITRAAEELHIVMSPRMLGTAASKPRIKGDTLKAKLEFYADRLQERMPDAN